MWNAPLLSSSPPIDVILVHASIVQKFRLRKDPSAEENFRFSKRKGGNIFRNRGGRWRGLAWKTGGKEGERLACADRVEIRAGIRRDRDETMRPGRSRNVLSHLERPIPAYAPCRHYTGHAHRLSKLSLPSLPFHGHLRPSFRAPMDPSRLSPLQP